MDNPANAVLAFILGIAGGMILLSLVGRWIAAVWSAIRDGGAGATRASRAWSVLAALLLHSGAWALLIAGGVTWQIASGPHEAWWTGFAWGAAAAPVILAVLMLTIARRRRQPRAPYVPLTAASLAAAKRRFMWLMTLLWGGGVAPWMMVSMRYPLITLLVLLPLALLGGYLFALIMWQFHRAFLQSSDIERRKQAETPEVANAPD